MRNGRFDLEVLQEKKMSPSFITHSFIHSFTHLFIILSSEMEQTLPEKSNSIQFLVIFHVSTYLHHSGNFHIRNKQLFIVHSEDIGRYNDLLFPPSAVYVFLKENLLLFEAFKWLSLKYHSDSMWSSPGQSQYIIFPLATLIESGKDRCVPIGWDYQSPQDTFSWAIGKEALFLFDVHQLNM